MSEKTPTNADKGTEKATQGGDESSTEITDQTDTSQSEEKDSNLEENRQKDQQLARDNDDLEQKQNLKEPPKETKKPGPQETMEPGPPQGPEETQQDHKIGQLPNQGPESKETQDPSPPQTYESEGPPLGNQEPESMETLQSSPSHTLNPADKTPLDQNAGQQPTEEGIPQEPSQLQTQNNVDTSFDQNSGSQAAEKDRLQKTQEPGQPKPNQQESDQQPTETGHKHSNPPHSEEIYSQENNEKKKNDKTDPTPPTKLETTIVETSEPKSEEETPSVSDYVDTKHQPQNDEDVANTTNVDTPNQPAELTDSNETSKEQNIISPLKPLEKHEITDKPKPPFKPDPAKSHVVLSNQDDDIPKELENNFEPDYEDAETSGEKTEFILIEQLVSTETEQEGEGQTRQTRPAHQEQGDEIEKENMFPKRTEPKSSLVLFIEKTDQPAIRDVLSNCRKYKDEISMEGNLEDAFKEYEHLLKKAKETGCKKQESVSPPSELSSVNDKERNQAPLLYAVIADVSKKVPSYKRWGEAVSEFISLTTLSQPEPHSSKKKRTKSQSGYQNKTPVKPTKFYNNNIEKLLDQDSKSDRFPGPSVHNDYCHLFTCESVLRSTFPEADIFCLVDSAIRRPEDVPPELQHKALFHFLLSINPKKYGVEPSDAWKDFGRLVLAEKQLELAKKAQGPDLHQNIIVKRLDFYRMQNELKEKTEEVEELSTRLSKFASQQLTEGNPNIADLSDTHRPTRLGEMYSQLFDDEWSEAFEAFKSTMSKESDNDDDDELYPSILSILQTLVTEAFSFCREKSSEQLQDLENKIKEALKQNTADTPQTKTSDSVEKMEVDQSPPEAGDNKVEKPSQNALDQTVERHSKELRKAASAETVKYQAQIFIKESLPKVLPDDKVRQDQSVISYVQKCVELCWFMNVQDPPMELVAPKEGDSVDKNLFSHHGRKGKVVQTCVWAALLLHKEGPVVCKGYILPKPK